MWSSLSHSLLSTSKNGGTKGESFPPSLYTEKSGNQAWQEMRILHCQRVYRHFLLGKQGGDAAKSIQAGEGGHPPMFHNPGFCANVTCAIQGIYRGRWNWMSSRKSCLVRIHGHVACNCSTLCYPRCTNCCKSTPSTQEGLSTGPLFHPCNHVENRMS